MDALERLASAVGRDRIRPAGADDAIGGHEPQAVVEPVDANEVAEILRCASADGIAVAVRGGGSKLDWGPTPARCDAILSTRALDRIVEYEPGDMTCIVEAGIAIDALQAHFRSDPTHRQALMLDPPGDGATVGGVVATNAAGPRRTRYGTPRDLLLGVRYVTGDGLIARAGGKVVKNVAGFDVAKVLTGSLGTLAVITETAWKLHPIPDTARTVVADLADAEALGAACAALRRAPIVPTAVEVLWPERLILVRIESTTAGAEAQAAEAAALLGDEARIVDADEGDALLDRSRSSALHAEGPVIAVGVLPRALPDLAHAVERAGARLSARALLVAGEVCLPDADPDRLRGLVERVRDLGGNVLPRHLPSDLANLVPGPNDAGARIVSAALKRELDPSGILAPGREPAAIA